MSVQGLQNPYERLQVLPTTMNWRGLWLVTQTYFKNDIVVSPANGASYVLANQTAVNGGADPSVNPEYVELSPLSTGIIGITQGTAIGISGPPNNPTITNNGVRTVDGDGVTVVVDNTDPNNPVISSNSITVLQPGSGISIDNANPQIPVVSNTGVRQILAADSSVNVSNPTGIVTISANGLIGVTPGLGISVTGSAQNPVIANSGVASLVVSTGLSSTGGVNPTIANTGVLSVTPADSSIIAGGTAQNVTLRTSAPVLTAAFSADSTGVLPANPGLAIGISVTTRPTASIFFQYLANGAPDPTGIFIIDMSQFLLRFNAAGAGQVLQNVFTVIFRNGATNYTSSTVLNNGYLNVGLSYPIVASGGLVYLNVAEARAAGLTGLTQILILNATNGELQLVSGPAGVNATYYPLGLQ